MTDDSNDSSKLIASEMVIRAAIAGFILFFVLLLVSTVSGSRARSWHPSNVNTCISNLRIIDGAKGQWALENHKELTDIPTANDIQPYMGRGPRGELPICPSDPDHTFATSYKINSVGTKPECKILPSTHNLQ